MERGCACTQVYRYIYDTILPLAPISNPYTHPCLKLCRNGPLPAFALFLLNCYHDPSYRLIPACLALHTRILHRYYIRVRADGFGEDLDDARNRPRTGNHSSGVPALVLGAGGSPQAKPQRNSDGAVLLLGGLQRDGARFADLQTSPRGGLALQGGRRRGAVLREGSNGQSG